MPIEIAAYLYQLHLHQKLVPPVPLVPSTLVDINIIVTTITTTNNTNSGVPGVLQMEVVVRAPRLSLIPGRCDICVQPASKYGSIYQQSCLSRHIVIIHYMFFFVMSICFYSCVVQWYTTASVSWLCGRGTCGLLWNKGNYYYWQRIYWSRHIVYRRGCDHDLTYRYSCIHISRIRNGRAWLAVWAMRGWPTWFCVSTVSISWRYPRRIMICSNEREFLIEVSNLPVFLNQYVRTIQLQQFVLTAFVFMFLQAPWNRYTRTTHVGVICSVPWLTLSHLLARKVRDQEI